MPHAVALVLGRLFCRLGMGKSYAPGEGGVDVSRSVAPSGRNKRRSSFFFFFFFFTFVSAVRYPSSGSPRRLCLEAEVEGAILGVA